VIVLLLSSFYVSGYGFDIDVKTIKSSIFINEGAEYKLTIRNNLDYENRYRIVVPDFASWSVQTAPQSHRLSGILIPANSEVSTTLLIYPTEKVWPGRYQIKLVVNSEKTDEEVRKVLDLSLVSGEYHQAEFRPELKIDIEIPDNGKMDPRNKQILKIHIKNKNLLNIVDLSIKLKSSLIDEQKSGITLEPLQKKIEEFPIVFDLFQEPIEDTLTTTVSVQNKSFTVVQSYQIVAYYEPFEEEIETKKGFLKTKQLITLTNLGNAEIEEAYKIKTNLFKRLFTLTKPKAVVVRNKVDKISYLKWNIKLPAQDSIMIEVTTNYLPLFLIIIFVLIGTASYYIFRSPLIIKKDVREIKKKHDGISEIKLMLTVKNRSRNPVNNIKVTDKIPNIIQIERDFSLGTIQPSKITKHERRGTIITWNLDSLEEREERIITYRIKSKLSIVGRFVLPPASIKFKHRRKMIVVHSNLVSLE